MSKVINLKLFKTIAVALFAFVALLPGSIARAQPPGLQRGVAITIFIRVGGVNHQVPRTCDYYTASFGNPLTTSKHSLPNNPRYLNHIAPGTLTYPDNSANYFYDNKRYSTGPPDTFTPLVEAFWDHNLYGTGYTKVSGANPAMNCHGYSTGKGVWLDDFQKLMSDDYIYYGYSSALASGAIVGDNNHSIKIKSVLPLGNLHITTSEKYRDSGVYERAIVVPYLGMQFELPTLIQVGPSQFTAGTIGPFSFFYKKN